MTDLFDKPHVKNHPLIRDLDNRLNEAKRMYAKHAQLVQEEEEDINDMFSGAKYEEDQLTAKAKTLPEITFDAIRVAERTLDQFEWPLRPEVTYNNAINIKNAAHDETVVAGEIVLNCVFRNVAGQKKHATLYIPIHRGNAIPPSTIEFDGRREVLAQSVLDEMIDRITAYDLEPLRGMYDAPFDSLADREVAVKHRNEKGWKPKENPNDYMIMKNSNKLPAGWDKAIEVMEDAEESGLDTFPRPFQHLETTYLIPLLGNCSKDKWYTHLVNKGFCLNEYGTNRGRGKDAQLIDKELDLEVEEPLDIIEEPMLPPGPKMYNGTKMPIELNDAIKFKGKDNTIRGQIVELDPESDVLIVKSKGLEYRVKVEDIEPMPSTFKKMWV